MVTNHDVVVIGGGHNALIVAAYLGKAGLDVCLVEKQDKVGGSIVTRELTLPGFKHDFGSIYHETLRGNPLMENDELGLISKYGLKYLSSAGPVVGVIYPDDRALFIYADIDKTCESIAQFSKRDAEVFPKFCEASARLMTAARIATFSPPPPFGTFVSFLEASEEGREYLRVMLSSPMDVAEEWFESEEVKVLIYQLAHPSGLSPNANGTGLYGLTIALIQSAERPLRSEEKGVGLYGSIPQGGSGVLAEVLEACIKDHGGTVITSRGVKTIKAEAGDAKGVVLDDGEEINAKKAVVSGINVKQLFLDMLKPDELPPNFQDRVRRIKHMLFAPMDVHLALENAPKYKAGGDANEACYMFRCPFMKEYLQVEEGYSRGIPSTKLLNIACFTHADPSRAPAGKHTLRICQNQPYSLEDGGPAKWDEIKEEIADGIIETLRWHTTNMGDENILGRNVVSPLDFERANPAMMHGDVNHIHQGLSQFYSNRPLSGWSHYRTPVKKLYMCGASVHPGGGVNGSGRITAQVIMEDLGINFKKVVSK